MHGDRSHFWRGTIYLALAVSTLTSGLRGVGEFRCRLGMAEAGPECPVCHGSEVPSESSTFGQPCCEFVEGVPPPSMILTACDRLPAPSASPLPPISTHLQPTPKADLHEVVAHDIGPPDQNKPLFLRL